MPPENGYGDFSDDYSVGTGFADALGIDVGSVSDQLAYNSIPQWDSVAHMGLIAQLEDCYGVLLDTDDIIDMSSVAKARRSSPSTGSPSDAGAAARQAGVDHRRRARHRARHCPVVCRAGAELWLAGRDEAALSRLADELGAEFGVSCHSLCVDVAQPQAVKQAFQQLFAQTRQLDVLVNNAGMLEEGLLGMVNQAQLEQTFSHNTFSVVYCSQYAARLMQRSGGGSIINLASLMGRVGPPAFVAMPAARRR